MDYLSYNRQAWDRQVAKGNPWTIPADSDLIQKARDGDWSVVLTPTKPVPREWFGEMKGQRILALASGGGQQVPVFAAAGAIVTSLDNSPAQLQRDREVAERERLEIQTILGDMSNLSDCVDASFDLVFIPCSTSFVPDVRPVWRECFRVLVEGGRLLAGFANPVLFLFDDEEMKRGTLTVAHRIPYSDLESLTDAQRQRYVDDDEPFCFGHTLTDLMGGQLDAGFMLAAMYEDRWPEGDDRVLGQYMDPYLATLAVKPRSAAT